MSSPETNSGNAVQLRDEALGRSVFYGILSLALHSPTAEILCELQSEQARNALFHAASILGSLPPLEESEEENSTAENPSVDLPARAEDWSRTLPSLTLDRLLDLHGRVFGHTARGPVCLYETEYGAEALFQQPRQLARITGFYGAFGLTPREAERERADHASCELEFLDFLSRKEAVALECGDAAMLQETRKAGRIFLKDHLGRFGHAFARRLREQDPEGFLGKLGDLLFAFLTHECARLRIHPGPPSLQLRSAEEIPVPMACGEGSDLVQLQTQDIEE